MPAPSSVIRLIERYRTGTPPRDEGTLCREFIGPMLEILGWGMGQSGDRIPCRTGLARDVQFRVGGRIRYIDYVLSTPEGDGIAIMAGEISGQNLSAFDLRRYAWNAGLALAILTNFRESVVYDTTVPVRYGDDADTSRIATVTISQVAGQWERVAAVLSREAVLRGSIGSFQKERGIIRKESGVVQVLRADLESWRLLLAKRIALHNDDLSPGRINEVVQFLLTRILFLRIAEDRGIGEYGLLSRITRGGSAYGRFCGLLKYAGEEFGGDFFCPCQRERGEESADALVLTLVVNDDIVKTIIARLTPPESPYEFSVITARTLAEVFSPFLGSVIRLPGGHQAIVEERPEVRKAGGLSVTAGEIAWYLVKSTLSGLLEKKTPTEISHLSLLDPACGSGLFLVTAYEYLLDWHLSWYTGHLVPVVKRGSDDLTDLTPGMNGWKGMAGSAPPITRCTGRKGYVSETERTWRLAPEERKRILCAVISGVDIDLRAVTTTKFLLLVTLIEGMDREGLPLPDLSARIQCGNSLVDPDIFDDPDAALINPGARERLRVFDWDAGFPHIMASGGFDVVIGHLPGLHRESLRGEKEYLERHYQTCPGTADLSSCFVERGISLLRPGGIFSAIFPGVWLHTENGARLRRFLGEFRIEEIIELGDQRGANAGATQTCIIRVAKEKPGPTVSVIRVRVPWTGAFEEHLDMHRYLLPRSHISERIWMLEDTRVQDLVGKIRLAGTPLGEYVMGEICRGIRIEPGSPFLISAEMRERLVAEDPESATLIRPFLSCKELRRYRLPPVSRYLIVVPHGTDLKEYPSVFRYLLPHKRRLVQMRRTKSGKGNESGAPSWYELPGIKEFPGLLSKPKIIYPGIAEDVGFSLDPDGLSCPGRCQVIGSSSLYLLGILNSSLIRFFMRQTLPPFRGGLRRFSGSTFESIPIFIPDFDDPRDATHHDCIEALVQQMLIMQRKSIETDDPGDKLRCQHQIRELDCHIDTVVCDLYHLTPGEIRITGQDFGGEESR